MAQPIEKDAECRSPAAPPLAHATTDAHPKGGSKTMKASKTAFSFFASGLLVALLSAGSAQAQVSLDISKITCDQFTLFKVTDPRNIAIWISGYYNGKRNNTVIDTQQLNEYYDK